MMVVVVLLLLVVMVVVVVVVVVEARLVYCGTIGSSNNWKKENGASHP